MPRRRKTRAVIQRSLKLTAETLETRQMLSADFWQGVTSSQIDVNQEPSVEATQLRTFRLEQNEMRQLLDAAPLEFGGESGVILELPRPDGGFESFEVFKTYVMHPDLAAKFPEILTLTGRSLTSGNTVRIDQSQLGFGAQVIGPTDSYNIDTYFHLNTEFYASYFWKDSINDIGLDPHDHVHDPNEDIEDPDHTGFAGMGSGGVDASDGVAGSGTAFDPTGRPSGSELRVYRTAVNATAEYTQFFGGTVADGLAAVVSTINRVTGIYENDLSVRLELVPTNDQLIFTDPATDPFTQPFVMNVLQTESAATLNNPAILGVANYDVGHVFGFDTGAVNGNAGAIGSFGNDATKGLGATKSSRPDVDEFDLVAAHEFGHQAGGNHTWAHCGFPSFETAFFGATVEPGSGSTIMSYAGICGADNIEPTITPYFHSFTNEQILDYLESVPNVGTRIATGNTAPNIEAGANYIIPASTPFELTATGSDPNGDIVTYSWEQIDAGNNDPRAGDQGDGPLFRVFPPVEEPNRIFPVLDDILNGTSTFGMTLPTTNRDLNFRVFARDGRGGTNHDDMNIQVIDTGSPFQITSANGGEVLEGNQQFTFNWDVAGTNTGLINTPNVRIRMSTDGGQTFPFTVLDSTPNDGSETATVPNIGSETVRFRIEGVNNIFFDISDANLTVEAVVIDVCGVSLPQVTGTVPNAVGANFFASNHAILDNDVAPGQAGFDLVVLDFLRDAGNELEIPRDEYSIAVLGSGTTTWSFSNDERFLPVFERTTFFNIASLTPQNIDSLLAHDALIVLSSDSAVTGGLTDAQAAILATFQADIAAAMNERGMDLWVGAAGTSAAYHGFLPAGVLVSEDEPTVVPVGPEYRPTMEGELLGLTSVMTNVADTDTIYTSFDSDLAIMEMRNAGETVSVFGRSLAVVGGGLSPVAALGNITTDGIVGHAYRDDNHNGHQDPSEPGMPGTHFFLDLNGDGLLGLCEPTATSDVNGNFQLWTFLAGNFEILPVPEAGRALTSGIAPRVNIGTDGTAIANAPLDFGFAVGNDVGSSGKPGSVPVGTDAYLGDNPVKDDGVYFVNGLQKGANQVWVDSNVVHGNFVMNAWMDFNKDGDWNDPGEQILTNVVPVQGLGTYAFNIPQNVFDDSVLGNPLFRLPLDVRFRVGPTLNVGPNATDIAGEIEDYKVFISQGPDSGLQATSDTFNYVENQAGQFFDVLANDSSLFGRPLTVISIDNISPVVDPPLELSISANGTGIDFNATGVTGLAEDITFEYTVQDSSGATETATVTLVANAVPAMIANFQNPTGLNADVSGDGFVTGRDLSILLRELKAFGSRTLPNMGAVDANFVDINGDQNLNAFDLLVLSETFRQLNQVQSEPIEAEPIAAPDQGTSSGALDVADSAIAAPLTSLEAEQADWIVADISVASREQSPSTSPVFLPIERYEAEDDISLEGVIADSGLVEAMDFTFAAYEPTDELLLAVESEALWGDSSETDEEFDSEAVSLLLSEGPLLD